jgi:hypothetical protein
MPKSKTRFLVSGKASVVTAIMGILLIMFPNSLLLIIWGA